MRTILLITAAVTSIAASSASFANSRDHVYRALDQQQVFVDRKHNNTSIDSIYQDPFSGKN